MGLAALKYGDLSNQASKDYIFDVDRFTSFTGNTGPYILYTIVRIKSILAKYAAKAVSYTHLDVYKRQRVHPAGGEQRPHRPASAAHQASLCEEPQDLSLIHI